jgi:midasin (ATPase involved in ribosome maturation)
MNKADAMTEAGIERPTARARVLEFPRGKERTPSEDAVDARLAELKHFVDDFSQSASSLLLTEKRSVREAIEELAVKLSALEWIVRVAKHSSGRVHSRLWVDIDAALTDLEHTAESVARVTEKWGRSNLGSRREPVLSLDRF